MRRSVVAGLWPRPWRPSKDHITASANRSSPNQHDPDRGRRIRSLPELRGLLRLFKGMAALLHRGGCRSRSHSSRPGG
jgi:hypothetical protein